MILIGSRAMLFRCPQLLNREPMDFDFASKSENEVFEWCKNHGIDDAKRDGKKIISEANKCEFLIAEPNTSDWQLIDIVESDPKTIKTEFGLIPSLNLLFALKKSHRYLKNSPHFWKTAIDYHKMKAFGCEVQSEHLEWFKLREKETYNYSHPKLNVMKKDFFKDDAITYIFFHDDIHEAIAIRDKPAYKYYMKDGAEVQSDKQKFFSLPKEIQLAGVWEETTVLSLERSIIPFPKVMTIKQAWMFALSKVCSSITSGWFREFAYEHIFEVVKMYDENYVKKFEKAVEDGIVRRCDTK